MPETTTDQAYTDTEVSTFADKLAAWGDSLPEREQVLLSSLMAEACGDEDDAPDVEGYGRNYYGKRRYRRRYDEEYTHHRRRRYASHHGCHQPNYRESCYHALQPMCGYVKPRCEGGNRYYHCDQNVY